MNRSAINSAPLGIGYSTANQFFSASGLLRLINTTLSFGGAVNLSAAITFALESAESLGLRVLMAAENALLTLGASEVLGVGRLAAMPAIAQSLRFSATETGAGRVALASDGELRLAGPNDMGAYVAQWFAASGSMTLTSTANFYDGPRTPAPAERTTGIVDLTPAARTSGTVSLGA